MHVSTSTMTEEDKESRYLELDLLSETAGAHVVGHCYQTIEKENAATMIGSGKLDELHERATQCEANLIIFSVDLTGSQLRNIEVECACRVIDRTQLILDIFANRAMSFEGKAQVRLAQLMYLLPRLTGRGVAMSRLGAGIGTRGPGETKLETDRRKIRTEIHDLRRVVQAQGKRRTELRRRRSRQGVYSVGIVGYTNAGKTTLLSRLAKRFGERNLEQGKNRLFDTLDLVSRRITYGGRTFVFTDTVGFLRDLPHHLVDAFRATLEEAVDADVLVHVVDATSEQMAKEMHTVYEVLEQSLHVNKPVITVFNEKQNKDNDLLLVDKKAISVVWGSILEDRVIEELVQKVDEVAGARVHLRLVIPHERSDVLALAYQKAKVEQSVQLDDGLYVTLEIDRRDAGAFLPFVAHDGNGEDYFT